MPGLPFEELPVQNDPLAMLDEMTKRQLVDLDQQVIQAEQQATAESSNRLRTLQDEYGIERRGLEQEWNQFLGMNLDSETLQKHSSRLRLELLGLNKKYELASTRISGKNRPDLLTIQQAKQNAIIKINQQATARQIEIQTYRKLEQEGLLDQYESKAVQLRTLGYEVSASQLRPATLKQQIDEIDAEMKLLDANMLNLGGKNPEEITPQERAAFKSSMYARRNQLARQMGGQYVGPIQTATRLQRVAAGQMAGPFAQGIAEQKPTKKPMTKAKMDTYKKAGLTKIQAMQMAASEGYAVD